jgi:O-antigen ligase
LNNAGQRFPGCLPTRRRELMSEAAIVTAVAGIAVLAMIFFVARRRPTALLLVALASLAMSPRYLQLGPALDPQVLDDLQKIALLVAVSWYVYHHGLRRLELLPVATLGLIALLSFGPAEFHPELTAFQVLRSFLALAAIWLFLAARRPSQDARSQLLLLTLLPILNLAFGVFLWLIGLKDLVRHEYTGAWRLQGATIPAHLGMLTVIGVAAGMQRWVVGRRCAASLVACNLAVAVLTGTRSAILLSLVIVTAGLASPASLLRVRSYATAPRAAAFALAVGAVVYLELPAMRDRFFGNPLEGSFNTSGRVGAWKFFSDAVSVDPLFGRGLGAATVANTGQLPPAFRLPHNEYLRLLVDAGWVGLILFIGTAAVAMCAVLRRAGPTRRAVGTIICVWAAYCFVDNALSTPQASFLFPTVIACLAARPPFREAERQLRGTRPIVLYITGVSRSGSTLLERTLDRLPGVVSVGELTHVWDRGAAGDESCSCGQRFSTCAFWTAVRRRVPGGWHAATVDHMLQLQRRVVRHRMAPLIICSMLTRSRRRDMEAYSRSLAAVYAAVAAVSRARVVVDSSKLPISAHVLAMCGHVDLRVLHLVRDSRAHAFSFRKRVRRPESASGEYMPRPGVLRGSLEWLGFHVLSEGMRGRDVPYERVSYERFVSQPSAVVKQLGWMVDLPAVPEVVSERDGTNVIELLPRHSVSGNPMRFSAGAIAVRLDDEWRRGLPRRLRWLVTVLTAPGLARYGYLKTRPTAKLLHRPAVARQGERPIGAPALSDASPTMVGAARASRRPT